MTLVEKYKVEGLIGSILTILEPTIQEKLVRFTDWFVKEYDNNPGKYDLEYYEMNIVYDLCRSLEKYTITTDKILWMESRNSIKGNLIIEALIERDSVKYDLSTEAIYAGGYNIQRLHYRYLTNTKLPQTTSNTLTTVIKDKIKKLTKAEKLNNDLKTARGGMLKYQNDIDINSKVSDSDIFEILSENGKLDEYTWEMIIDNGADKNYDFDKDIFIASKNKYNQSMLDFWKKQNITWKQNRVTAYAAEIKKLLKKIVNL